MLWKWKDFQRPIRETGFRPVVYQHRTHAQNHVKSLDSVAADSACASEDQEINYIK